jgi:alpha-galactosidase
MSEKMVLIGAGSAMFTGALVADAAGRGWEGELGLVDTDSDALAVAEGLCKKIVEGKGARLKISASLDRRNILPGATIVVTTIGVGGRRAWEQDVYIPRKYGIFQPVGDSVMPGGTSRALRMVPPMVDIANDVVELAPNALFFNYANPMGVVCRAVRKMTKAKMVGLCIGVWGIGNQLARFLGVEQSEFQYTAVGMNHLAWFTEVRARGENLMPRLQQRVEEALAAGNPPGRLCCRLFQIFGPFPAVGDRHVSEFFPGLFPDGNPDGKLPPTERGSFEGIIREGDRIYAEMREKAFSKEPLEPDYFEKNRGEGEHEQATEIVESIRRDLGHIYSANLPNTGQVPNFPPEAILECPAAATASGMKALAQPPLPPGVVGTLATRFAWVETVVEAALEGSRQKFVQALVLDGSVRDLDTAEKLADDLLAAQAEYLPRFAGAAGAATVS